MYDFQKFLQDNLDNIFGEGRNDSLLFNLGNLIKKKRKSIGYSQKQLSILTNIPQANISRIEKGLSNLSINQLKKIADALQAKIIIKLE